jgi:hypothetical protein
VSDRYTTAGVAAAVAAGRRLGLPSEHPEVFAFGANVLVRLGPAVARVPATTLITRLDTEHRLACDVAISTFLADRHAPVVEPWEDPGPHVLNGLPVTLWRFTRHDPARRFAPAEVGALLAHLHEALRDYPGELPVDPRFSAGKRWARASQPRRSHQSRIAEETASGASSGLR